MLTYTQIRLPHLVYLAIDVHPRFVTISDQWPSFVVNTKSFHLDVFLVCGGLKKPDKCGDSKTCFSK